MSGTVNCSVCNKGKVQHRDTFEQRTIERDCIVCDGRGYVTLDSSNQQDRDVRVNKDRRWPRWPR